MADEPKKPLEIPVPGQPEINPGREPQPVTWPGRDPEILPARDPEIQSPPKEIPPPPEKQGL